MFPRLPLLDAVVHRMGSRYRRDLESAVFVCGQHLLETTGSLIECLLRCGVRADRVFLQGKFYSTNTSVVNRLRNLGVTVFAGSAPTKPGYHLEALRRDVERMWQVVLGDLAKTAPNAIVVLDDGAQCTRSLPTALQKSCPIVAIEQTTSGDILTPDISLPVISVSSSAIKCHLEPPMIVEAILQRTSTLLDKPLNHLKCGIVGLGNIGRSLAEHLIKSGVVVAAYDLHQDRLQAVAGAKQMESAQAVLAASDVLFGCTGSLASLGPLAELRGLSGIKTLASCSTSDIEFRTILKTPNLRLRREDTSPCAALVLESANGMYGVRVLRSGFPVNFDNTPESVPADRIQLTRALLLGAVFQALDLLAADTNPLPTKLMLDAYIQRYCALNWFRISGIPSSCKKDKYSDLMWLASQSGGIPSESTAITESFAQP